MAEGLKRFAAHTADPKAHPIHADLRQVVYRIALNNSPGPAVSFLKNEWQTTVAPDGKEVCLLAIGHISDEAVASSILLPFLFDTGADTIPSGDMHILGSGLAQNRVTRSMLWAYIQQHWDEIQQKTGNPVVLDRFVRVSLSYFSESTALDEIEAFFKDKDVSAFNRTLETVKDTIRGRVAYRERDAAVLREVSTCGLLAAPAIHPHEGLSSADSNFTVAG